MSRIRTANEGTLRRRAWAPDCQMHDAGQEPEAAMLTGSHRPSARVREVQSDVSDMAGSRHRTRNVVDPHSAISGYWSKTGLEQVSR